MCPKLRHFKALDGESTKSRQMGRWFFDNISEGDRGAPNRALLEENGIFFSFSQLDPVYNEKLSKEKQDIVNTIFDENGILSDKSKSEFYLNLVKEQIFKLDTEYYDKINSELICGE